MEHHRAIKCLTALSVLILAGCRHAVRPNDRPETEAQAVFSGLVRDSLTPVPNISLDLYKGSTLLARAITDQSGRFQLPAQVNGNYALAIRSAEYTACRFDVSIWPPYQDAVIGVVPVADSTNGIHQQIRNGSACSCRYTFDRPGKADSAAIRAPLPLSRSSNATFGIDVVDPEDGRGIPKAEVILTTTDANSGDLRLRALTDETGRAIFLNLSPNKYHVLARRIGFAANQTDIAVTAGAVDSLTLAFKWDRSIGCFIIRTGR